MQNPAMTTSARGATLPAQALRGAASVSGPAVPCRIPTWRRVELGSAGPAPSLRQICLARPCSSLAVNALSEDASAAAYASSGTASFLESASTSQPYSNSNGLEGAASSSQPGDGLSSSAVEQGPYILISGAYVLPHPDKMAKGGEDWFYVAETMRSVGVADGVGGWAEIGVDAGAYARQLMGHAKAFADEWTKDGSPEYEAAVRGTQLPSSTGPTASTASGASMSMDLVGQAQSNAAKTAVLQQTILEKAYYKTDVRGSSTACVVVVAGTRLLASNLGDSGFLVLRNGQVVFHSPQQQHDFNFPYQIGSFDSMSDPPQASQRFELFTQPGDVIVMGTDGLWDNCFDEEVASVINYCQDVNMPMDKTAQVLAHYARHRASDPKFASPFAYSAFQAGFAYMGGKMDDITVVVARIAPASEVQGGPLPGQGGTNLSMPTGNAPLPTSKL